MDQLSPSPAIIGLTPHLIQGRCTLERWESESSPQAKGDKPQRALYGKTKTYGQQEDIDILGRDLAGPLAPLSGPKALLQCKYELSQSVIGLLARCKGI
jgi:hypothetical protein